jgi:hypothetical protein
MHKLESGANVRFPEVPISIPMVQRKTALPPGVQKKAAASLLEK